MSLICFSFSAVGPYERVNYDIFLLNLMLNFIDIYRIGTLHIPDIYRTGTVLSLILLVSEMLKIPRANVEVHFRKKLAVVTSKCLAQDTFVKGPRTTEKFSKYTAVRQ